MSIKNIHFDDRLVGVKELTIKWQNLTCYQRIEVSSFANDMHADYDELYASKRAKNT